MNRNKIIIAIEINTNTECWKRQQQPLKMVNLNDSSIYLIPPYFSTYISVYYCFISEYLLNKNYILLWFLIIKTHQLVLQVGNSFIGLGISNLQEIKILGKLRKMRVHTAKELLERSQSTVTFYFSCSKYVFFTVI